MKTHSNTNTISLTLNRGKYPSVGRWKMEGRGSPYHEEPAGYDEQVELIRGGLIVDYIINKTATKTPSPWSCWGRNLMACSCRRRFWVNTATKATVGVGDERVGDTFLSGLEALRGRRRQISGRRRVDGLACATERIRRWHSHQNARRD